MAKNYSYIHRGKITNWHEGLMVGNGFFGALIYGDKELTLSLDRIDLWDDRKPPETKENGFTYQNMIKTMKEDWDEYLRLFDGSYLHPYPTKLNAGAIIFHTEIKKSDVFKLDIKKPHFSIKVSGEDYSGYLDANHDILVVFCPKTAQFSLKMPEYLSRQDEKTGLFYPKAIEGKDGQFSYIIQETKCDFSFAILVLDTTLDGKRVLLSTVVKNSGIEKGLSEGKELLLSYLIDINNNEKEHYHYWRKYYSTSTIVTGDDLIDRTYNFGRYFFGCCSKREYPMALEGVWTKSDGNLPPWKGDYHMDINLQMSYESYMKTGNFKEGKVLVDYLWNNRKKFAKLAKSFCHSDGYFIPGVMTQDCTPLGGWPMYSLNPACAIWIASAFDNYYRFTGNKSFLKNKALPFFTNIEKCMSSLLVKNDKGYLQLEFSSSPEINECEKEAIFKHQSNFEIVLLHYLYKTLIDYSKELGNDPCYYESQLKQIADYARNDKGELMLSEDLEYDESHRHFSHLLCHKNLELFNPYINKEQIYKDYLRLEKYGHDEWVGFSFTEMSSLASYIGLGEEAYKMAFIFADGYINDNCFHRNMDFKNKGYSTIKSDAFTLEGNIGFVRAITDMMLRTTDGVITVFPAIPQKFIDKGVSFKNLRTQGNHKVSAFYKEGEESFIIKLAKPAEIKFYNNIGKTFAILVDNKEMVVNANIGDIIKISANKEIKYLGK